ncbi:MAG TPA: hypothetical protein PLX08_04345 [Bacteroidales bacterium]|nr:hypothetical protein [Bacteroidales bacterium]
MLIIPSGILAQNKNVSPNTRTDTIKPLSETDRHSLYAGAGYGSNMVYLGSTISQDQPYGYGNITYGFHNKLFASVSAVNLPKFEPLASFYIGGLSFSHVFNSWFDISAGFYRYQVDKRLSDTLFHSFNYGDVTLGIDWKLLYTKISYGSIISKDPQGYLQINNSRYFETPYFFNKKMNISFDPYINLLFGTLLTSEIINGTSEIATVQQYVTPWSSGSGGSVTSSAGNGSGYGSGGGNGHGSSSDSGQGSQAGAGVSTTTTVETTTTIPTTTLSFKKNFDLIEIEFGLPVSFNTNFMTIEAEPGYLLPAYSDQYFPGTRGFVFTMSCFFRIF